MFATTVSKVWGSSRSHSVKSLDTVQQQPSAAGRENEEWFLQGKAEGWLQERMAVEQLGSASQQDDGCSEVESILEPEAWSVEEDEKMRMRLEEQSLWEQLEREERERQAELSQFYTRHGFTSADEPRISCSLFNHAVVTYPLHKAAAQGDERIVALLLKEGASKTKKDSSGLTPAQVAQKKSKSGSHDGVLRLLGGTAGKARVGGA